METRKQFWTVLTALATLTGVGLAPCAQADDYIIGAEDVLHISFWQDPNLNTQVRVDLEGKIVLDIVGQIEAAGHTTEQLQTTIVGLISRLQRNISQVTVRVAQYNYNHVFVIGQVTVPGKISFEVIPDLWTIINESGGITDFGDLSRVTIIRGGDDAGRIEVVNLRAALAGGRLDGLPKLRRGDTMEIGRAPGQVLAGEIGAITEKKNLFYVIGAVATPGPVTYQENIDVLEALAMAGGPTDAADLEHTQLVLKDGNYAQTVRFDLKEYSRSGRPARYIMMKEDLVIVPVRREGFLSSGIGRIGTALTALATAFLLYDRLAGD